MSNLIAVCPHGETEASVSERWRRAQAQDADPIYCECCEGPGATKPPSGDFILCRRCQHVASAAKLKETL